MTSHSPSHPITAYRLARGLSTSEFARRVGVDRSSISKVENGLRQRIDPDAARKIYEATAGEVSLKALLYWPDIPLPELIEQRLPVPPKAVRARREG